MEHATGAAAATAALDRAPTLRPPTSPSSPTRRLSSNNIVKIYEKQYDDGRHTTEFFGMTTDNTKWRLIKTIDLFDENEPNWVEIQNGI